VAWHPSIEQLPGRISVLPQAVSSDCSKRQAHVFICAWCRNRIGRGSKPALAIVNWGMCQRCLRRKLAALEIAAKRFSADTGAGEPGDSGEERVKQLPAA
jgi:hypothetical protein